MPDIGSRLIADGVAKSAPTFDRSPDSTFCPVVATIESRAAERVVCRIRGLVVEFADSSGGWIRCVVPTRNISRTGLAVLTNQYVYPKTVCRVHLFCAASPEQAVPASVVRCRYLPGTGRLHEVGLRFDTPIDVSIVQRNIGECRVLICHDDASVHQIVPRLLNQVRVRISSVRSAAEAVRAAATERFDIVLLDVDRPGESGGLAVRDLRTRGFSRPIFALTSGSDPQTLRRCLAAGYSQIASQPLTRDSLSALIKSTQCEPLFSARAHERELIGRITEFVNSLPDRLAQVEIAFAAEGHAALEPIVRRLREDAAELGFEMLSGAAQEIESALRANSPIHALRDGLTQLSRLAHAAQCAPLEIVE